MKYRIRMKDKGVSKVAKVVTFSASTHVGAKAMALSECRKYFLRRSLDLCYLQGTEYAVNSGICRIGSIFIDKL